MLRQTLTARKKRAEKLFFCCKNRGKESRKWEQRKKTLHTSGLLNTDHQMRTCIYDREKYDAFLIRLFSQIGLRLKNLKRRNTRDFITARKRSIKADSARPEAISHMRRQHFPISAPKNIIRYICRNELRAF